MICIGILLIYIIQKYHHPIVTCNIEKYTIDYNNFEHCMLVSEI